MCKTSIAHIISLVGDESTYIPDDVIVSAIHLMRKHYGAVKDYIGYYTPAQLHFLSNTSQLNQAVPIPKPTIPVDKFSVNIHPLPGHWVTSCQHPDIMEIHVHDSLMSRQHFQQVLPQIKILYGREAVSRTRYKVVTQQSSDPICGVMAVAFAFACLLQQPCEHLNFDITRARYHLKDSLQKQEITLFPTLPTTTNINVYD